MIPHSVTQKLHCGKWVYFVCGPGTVDGVERLRRMTIDALTGVVAVSLVVVLICHLWPPPDDNSGPGGNAP